MAIKGIIFDLDGVYFESGKELFMRTLADRYALSYQEVREVFIKSSEMVRYKEGRMTGEQFWTFAREQWDIQAKTSELLTVLAQSYIVNREALRLIHKLRRKGYKIIACSNNFKERISVLDKRFNFLKDFDYTIFSYRYGLLKPELLRQVVSETGFSPEQILFLDDHEPLVAAAKRAGFIAKLSEDPARVADYLVAAGIKV